VGDKLLSRTVCVKKCPDADNETLECLPTKNIANCTDLKAYDTLTFLGGFCIPVQSETLSKVASTFSGMNIESVTESVIANRYIFLICLGFAFAVSYLFSVLLEHCTWVIVTVSIVGLLVGGTYISILSWLRYKNLVTEAEASANQEEMMSNANFYKWVSIVLWTALSIFLLVLICLFGRLVLAVNVIRAAADFVTDATGIVFVPVVVILMSFFFFVYWCYALMRLYSTGELYHHSSYPWGKIKTSQELR
jgi:solute carrier family 44 protein 1 (choline transporter-like protein)/choline transporter-like protein 2/4/5